MMASSSELTFDCKSKIFSTLEKSFGDQTTDQHTQKLEDFLTSLEEERLKIDAFKRELPLCMHLLDDAMEASRQQLQSERGSQATRPVLEQFIPIKNTSSPKVEINEGNIATDKAKWMTLWNQESEAAKAPQSPLTSPRETDMKLGKQRINGGGAFHPFTSKDRGLSPSCEGFPELALASGCKEEMEDKRNLLGSKRESSGRCGNGSVEKEETINASQTHRKARRCWSPDLHRRFVNALRMLGGSQVATPKQIRELMKVDGLTNDEVKSHLQKYRLHTRRPSPSPQAAAPQVVVLGGIWVPPEYAAHGGAPAAALFGAHPSATHHVSPPFCSAAALPQDHIYQAIATHPNQHLHHHLIHHQQMHLYNEAPIITQRNSSPELDIQDGGGDPSESIEEGKSESGCWKADSGGDNGGERKEKIKKAMQAPSVSSEIMNYSTKC